MRLWRPSSTPRIEFEFFRDILAPNARRIPFGFLFVRLIDGVDLNHPEEIAPDRRVFELHPIH